MKEQLNLLVELQRIESDVAALRAKEKDLPKKRDALLEEMNNHEKNLRDQQDRLDGLRKDHHQKELDLTKGLERIKKTKGRLLEVKTNKEYEAALKEIESTSEANGKIEDEIIVLLDEIDTTLNLVKAETSEIAKHRKKYEREAALIEEELASIDSRLQEKLQEQEKIRSRIASALIKKFDLIRGRRNGKAVVAVRHEVCDGCHMNIPPQMFNDLIRSETLILCPHCSRIIYFEELTAQQ
ncbi:MAG: C4-type zinc ribbon domain-containing protein [Syntrophales bacterium]|nr:C4-type zinc ribbon domain-containing protein [Syntrophales bacterium]